MYNGKKMYPAPREDLANQVALKISIVTELILQWVLPENKEERRHHGERNSKNYLTSIIILP